MTSDDTTGPDDDNVAGQARGATGDPVRDFLLGVAAQIDQLAALFGGTGGRATGQHATATAGVSADAGTFADLTGDITTLLTELGDLLARLIAALIAVLEAMANALRSTPASNTGDSAQPYQPIAVRIDVVDRSAKVHRPDPESEI
ncbi:hypothetical protein [Gordonia hankookensis]|uniref:Uncharacterized protein n=1 Tax=Gordonia hankookensis TaxID=589403 RepID=A0ABR7W5N0_9ACTN|nr:hypothetical protein [Gordonia hankookensis]MBD1318127.1 hypothetical protein [Gordonia hankookensis]